MSFCKLPLAVLAASGLMLALGLSPTGWLDRVVQFHKNNFFKEVEKIAPVNIKASLRERPPGYVDSQEWDYDSVIRLLTLIRRSENAKPVHKALRRMLQPTRRIMMSMKESMQKFPSIMQDNNVFYYDVEYTEEEDDSVPAPPPIPEDQVVLEVSNPVEARLPSAKISVKLLREILEARARAARQMPPTQPSIIPWKPMNVTIPIPGDAGAGGGAGDAGDAGDAGAAGEGGDAGDGGGAGGAEGGGGEGGGEGGPGQDGGNTTEPEPGPEEPEAEI